jgi:outer membrane protein TolC
MSSCSRWFQAAVVLLVASSAARGARAEDSLSSPVDRTALVNAALRTNPSVHAAEQRAGAAVLAADAEGRLPPPEAMVQVWQVPIAKPYAIDEGQMIMVGVGQTFPAPGSRGARERAGAHGADVERAAASDRARTIRRDVEHAFADYVEATSLHRAHLEHRSVAVRALALAQARHESGASLTDVTQAEVELARTDSDVITDRTRVDGARARLNALLSRDVTSPLGAPVVGDPETSAWDVQAAIAKARQLRPELRAADATREARREQAHAADQEAKLPAFSVAALYFAPTSSLPQHGYGMNASMSLPWLWGEASARRDARQAEANAAATEARAARIGVDADVATAEANVRAGALRLQALRDRALPASRRAFEVAWSGYESSRIDILTLLSARRSVVDIEREIILARASLDHALAELGAAVGAEVPRRPLGPLDAQATKGGGGHGE